VSAQVFTRRPLASSKPQGQRGARAFFQQFLGRPPKMRLPRFPHRSVPTTVPFWGCTMGTIISESVLPKTVK